MAALKKPVEGDKQLKMFSIKTLIFQKYDIFSGKKTQKDENNVIRWNLETTISDLSPVPKKTKENNNQFLVFQNAMKLIYIIGQCLGLNPVTGILELDVTKVRYRFFTLKVLYGLILGVVEAFSASLCAYRLLNHNISIEALGYLSFFLSAACTAFVFQRTATKWPALMKELHNCCLDEYVDPKLKTKCYSACLLVVFLSILEHVLAQVYKVAKVIDCAQNEDIDVYGEYIKVSFPWMFEFNIDYNYLPIGIILQITTIITLFSWNYSDLLIICISMYLTSIFNCIQRKIETAQENVYLPPAFWRNLREDYNRATRLVRSFDDVINSVVFISFANNLFFICLQLFFCLADGLRVNQQFLRDKCPNYPSGPFGGYEHVVYLIISLCYLFGRSLAVSLLAAGVHTASLAPGPALYSIPTSMYCGEIQRFLDQIHGDTVALSGLQFFNVKRELVLSVAGTIVTYELVLLQFSNEGVPS